MTTTRFADLRLDGSLTAASGSAAGLIYLGSDLTTYIQRVDASWGASRLGFNAHVIAAGDGTFDIGNVAGNRFRNLYLTGAIVTGDNISVPTSKKLGLNAGLTTYIMEIATNEMVFVAGGSQFLRFQAPGVLVIGGSMATTNSNAGNVLLQDSSAPSGNPTGGIFIWSQGGAGKARGTSGTVTTWAPAEPHCPVCGSDFGHEWSNPKFGGTLQVCMKCLVADLAPNKPYVRLLGAA